jgi:hypothetical protein
MIITESNKIYLKTLFERNALVKMLSKIGTKDDPIHKYKPDVQNAVRVQRIGIPLVLGGGVSKLANNLAYGHGVETPISNAVYDTGMLLTAPALAYNVFRSRGWIGKDSIYKNKK